MPNKNLTAIFAIFLGSFGIHHFYVGNMRRGILYLIFCWTYIPSLIGLIEGLLLFCMTEEKFHKTYYISAKKKARIRKILNNK